MTVPGGRPACQPTSRPGHPPALPPEFALAWSVSRSKALGDCERSVFWSYFGSRGAGLDPDDPRAVRAWALKHLTALPLVLGIAVHNAARAVVGAIHRREEPPSYDALLEAARGTLNHVWRSSQPDLVDRFWRYPGVHAALREVVYRGALRVAEIDQARWTLTSCIRHLVTAPVLADIARCAPSDVWLPDGGPVSFRVPLPPVPPVDVRGTADAEVRPRRQGFVWAAPDFCYVHTVTGDGVGGATPPLGLPPGERVWCVGDWKTGAAREADERLQLATYALWLESTGRPSRDGWYLGRIIGLRDASERWYAIGPEERSGVRAVIAADTAHLLGRMADPVQALPKPPDAWALARERRTCGSCNYLALCRDELAPLRERADRATSRHDGRPAAGQEGGPPGPASTEAGAASAPGAGADGATPAPPASPPPRVGPA